MTTSHDRQTLISQRFSERYGEPPQLWARAPGRVDLMGSHTDYNMGYVLTMTVDRDTWIAAAPTQSRMVHVASLNLPGTGAFSLDEIDHDPATPWTDYVRGIAHVLQAEGYELAGFKGLIHSTIPFGSGLSSSAALEMATAEILQMVSGFELEPVEQALLGQQAENQFVGVNSGILDQYSSKLGQAGCALLLDCRALSSAPSRIAAGLQVVICDTRAERNLSGTEYDERRSQCEEGVRLLQQWYPAVDALRDVSLAQFEAHEDDLPDVVARRCRFIIEENQRVLDLAEMLPSGNFKQLGQLMQDSFSGARDLYEISIPEMQAMMDAMMSAPGVVGARQAGAGFGGCMVSLVEADQVDAYTRHVQHVYQKATGLEPHVYHVTPSAGAGALLANQ